MTHFISRPDFNFYTSASQDVSAVCEALKAIDLRIFSYLKTFHSEENASTEQVIYLSNNPQWFEFYANSVANGAKKALFLAKKKEFLPGFMIWPPQEPYEVFNISREAFGSGYGVTRVIQSPSHTEFFTFSAPDQNIPAFHFFLNNLDIFERFILFFREKASPILHASHKHLLTIEKMPVTLSPQKNYDSEKETLLEKLRIRKIQLPKSGFRHIFLSVREMECALATLNGLNAQHIAEKLSISPRTVEIHLSTLKEKFNCHTKSELIQLLNMSGVREYQHF